MSSRTPMTTMCALLLLTWRTAEIPGYLTQRKPV